MQSRSAKNSKSSDVTAVRRRPFVTDFPVQCLQQIIEKRRMWNNIEFQVNLNSQASAGFRGLGPRVPTMSMCLAWCMTCACHLVIFISEESLFVDAIKLSVVQTALFHLFIVWYYNLQFFKVFWGPESGP